MARLFDTSRITARAVISLLRVDFRGHTILHRQMEFLFLCHLVNWLEGEGHVIHKDVPSAEHFEVGDEKTFRARLFIKAVTGMTALSTDPLDKLHVHFIQFHCSRIQLIVSP